MDLGAEEELSSEPSELRELARAQDEQFVRLVRTFLSVMESLATTLSEAYMQALQRLETSLTCNNGLMKAVAKFILRVTYEEKETTQINVARAKRWNSTKKKKMARLPPDEDSLYLHIRHANYQAHIIRYYKNPSAPVPPYDQWRGGRGEPGAVAPPVSVFEGVPKRRRGGKMIKQKVIFH